MYSRWIMTLLICVSLGIHAGVCQAEGGTEFANTAEAEAFGWKVTDDTRLSITRECKVGSYALQVQPQPGAKPYRGINLQRTFDLTGAGAGDKMVFHVKQNFGHGMRVQLVTDKGPLNYSFRLDKDRWTRVELALDMAKWENPKKAPWGKTVLIQFYATSFMKPEHYLTLDGLDITVGGEIQIGAGSGAEYADVEISPSE